MNVPVRHNAPLHFAAVTAAHARAMNRERLAAIERHIAGHGRLDPEDMPHLMRARRKYRIALGLEQSE